MRIEYETTLEEIADAYLRVVSRSNLLRRQRWVGSLIIFGLISGIVSVWAFFIVEGLLFGYILLILFGAVAAGVYWWKSFPKLMKRHCMKYAKEQLQTVGPQRFAVELRDDSIWTKQGSTQISFDWSNLDEMIDSSDGIEMYMRDGGFVFVRNKGFKSQEEREQFKEIVKRYSERASGTSASLDEPAVEGAQTV